MSLSIGRFVKRWNRLVSVLNQHAILPSGSAIRLVPSGSVNDHHRHQHEQQQQQRDRRYLSLSLLSRLVAPVRKRRRGRAVVMRKRRTSQRLSGEIASSIASTSAAQDNGNDDDDDVTTTTDNSDDCLSVDDDESSDSSSGSSFLGCRCSDSNVEDTHHHRHSHEANNDNDKLKSSDKQHTSDKMKSVRSPSCEDKFTQTEVAPPISPSASGQLCIICASRPRELRVRPCGHVFSCRRCYDESRNRCKEALRLALTALPDNAPRSLRARIMREGRHRCDICRVHTRPTYDRVYVC